MTPAELEPGVAEALRSGSLFPCWAYTISLVAALLGGFLGAYLRRKGDDLAARESFDALLDQAKKTMKETESIRQQLVGHSWINQQQWQLREKYYSAMLEHLGILVASLDARLEYYARPGSEQDDTHTDTENFKKQSQLGGNSLAALKKLEGPAAIVVSEQTRDVLHQLFVDEWSADNDAACPKDYLAALSPAASKAYSVILKEAKAVLCGAPA